MTPEQQTLLDRIVVLELAIHGIRDAAIMHGVGDEVGATIGHAELIVRQRLGLTFPLIDAALVETRVRARAEPV